MSISATSSSSSQTVPDEPLVDATPTPDRATSRTAARDRDRARRADLTADLLLRAAEAGAAGDEVERKRLLDQVVVLNMEVATSIASRYRSRGIATDDLHQVAYLALVKAVQGFDPYAGHNFLSYSVPTVRGELKRYFRDHGWTVRPPRRIQELQARISTADAELSYRLGRSPRPSEIAAHLEEDVENVREALAVDGCFTPASLDKPVGPEGDTTLGELMGADDGGQQAAEARVVLAPVVRDLGERDRRILERRFIDGWTQQEIASEIGVTQMQVSRLLSRILGDLRKELDDPRESISA